MLALQLSLLDKQPEFPARIYMALADLALGLRHVVPRALESIKGSLIYKYWKRIQRIPKAYMRGAVSIQGVGI